MFSLSYMSEYKGEIKTLKLKQNPFYFGLGYYEDVDGVRWDIVGVFGAGAIGNEKPFVQARPVNDRMPYYSTATGSHSNGFHQWIPFYFEIVS
jgi:hypothetical protein